MKEGRPRTNFVARQNASVVLQQNGLLIERFPYVCPEPVLAKRSFFNVSTALKRTVFSPGTGRRGPRGCWLRRGRGLRRRRCCRTARGVVTPRQQRVSDEEEFQKLNQISSLTVLK